VALFVRESGSAGAPTVVFLHGGRLSGWSWEPVVERMQRYHCLVPDLPDFGKSDQHGPFDMSQAAEAVAELILSRVESGPTHVVGFSLGAQVGVQLLAHEPTLVDRAVLCGTVVNTMPGVRQTQLLAGLLARTPWFSWAVKRHGQAHQLAAPAARVSVYREDMRRMTGARLAQIVEASAGFVLPEGLDKSDAHALFVTGTRERQFVHRAAAALAQRMPNGIDTAATGMRHDWPLRCPDLFSRTIDGWLSQTPLPPEIELL
jgi:pimeloyl-ACP methyl ester carboxylesterase